MTPDPQDKQPDPRSDQYSRDPRRSPSPGSSTGSTGSGSGGMRRPQARREEDEGAGERPMPGKPAEFHEETPRQRGRETIDREGGTDMSAADKDE